MNREDADKVDGQVRLAEGQGVGSGVYLRTVSERARALRAEFGDQEAPSSKIPLQLRAGSASLRMGPPGGHGPREGTP